MSISDPLIIDDVAPRERPTKIGGVDHVIVEAPASVIRQYRNLIIRQSEYGPDGSIKRILDDQGIGEFLVSECLYALNNGTRTKVSRDVIDKMRNPVVQQLYEACRELAQIGEYAPKTEEEIKAEQESLKNSPPATQAS